MISIGITKWSYQAREGLKLVKVKRGNFERAKQYHKWGEAWNRNHRGAPPGLEVRDPLAGERAAWSEVRAAHEGAAWKREDSSWDWTHELTHQWAQSGNSIDRRSGG